MKESKIRTWGGKSQIAWEFEFMHKYLRFPENQKELAKFILGMM